MNRSYCNSCGELVPATPQERGDRVFLVKECGACGIIGIMGVIARGHFALCGIDYDAHHALTLIH